MIPTEEDFDEEGDIKMTEQEKIFKNLYITPKRRPTKPKPVAPVKPKRFIPRKRVSKFHKLRQRTKSTYLNLPEPDRQVRNMSYRAVIKPDPIDEPVYYPVSPEKEFDYAQWCQN